MEDSAGLLRQGSHEPLSTKAVPRPCMAKGLAFRVLGVEFSVHGFACCVEGVRFKA